MGRIEKPNTWISWLQNDELVKDIKSVAVFLLAFIIAFVTNGLINEFKPELLFQWAVALSTIGLYFAIVIVMNEMATRAYNDQVDDNKELIQVRLDIKEESRNLIAEQAKPILKQYNLNELNEKKESAKEKAINSLTDKVDKHDDKITSLTIQKLRFYHIFKRLKRRKAKKKIKKYKSKIKKIEKGGIYVRYDYIELDDLKVVDTNNESNERSEKSKLNDDPIKRTNRKLAMSNFIKLFIFMGLQGAIFAQMESFWEFLLYLFVVTLTLGSTALISYEMTRRYTAGTHIIYLNDKLNLLKWVIKKQKGSDLVSESRNEVHKVDYAKAFAKEE